MLINKEFNPKFLQVGINGEQNLNQLTFCKQFYGDEEINWIAY